MKPITAIQPLMVAFESLMLTAFAIWRALRQPKALQGTRKVLMRNAMISTFSAGISISLSALMYFIWSGSKGQLMLVLASLGFAVFLATLFGPLCSGMSYLETTRVQFDVGRQIRQL